MAITLLRHTRPRVDTGICYGQLDLDVADTFEADAAAALGALPSTPTIIVSSPLKRCQVLAAFIAGKTRAPLSVDTRLMEMDFGTWEGIAWDAIPRAQLDEWAADFAHGRPHGGESVAMLKARVDPCIGEWASRAGSVLIVTHAGAIRATLAPDLEQESFNANISFGEHVVLS